MSYFSSLLLDIRLDWSTYNIEENDNQFLDMIVSYGQALPLFDSKGQELPPPPPVCDLSCFTPPLIQVKLDEHKGIRSNKPFEVKPSQQVNKFISIIIINLIKYIDPRVNYVHQSASKSCLLLIVCMTLTNLLYQHHHYQTSS